MIKREEILTLVLSVLNTIVEEWGEDVDSAFNEQTLLVEDVGFASIDFVQFVVAIEEGLGQKIGFQDMLMVDGNYVEDLSVENVVDYIASRLIASVNEPFEATTSHTERDSIEKIHSIPDSEKVNNEKFNLFTSILKPRNSRVVSTEHKNRPAVFVLSPPRSGSTLLRVMLAGNPQLFSPPELHLLSYADMAERYEALNDDHNNHLLEGTVRALMQIKGWDGPTARDFIDRCQDQVMSTNEFYAILQDGLGDRLLVDKTPTYVVDKKILNHALEDFENAYFIHLLRHPCGMIRSYEESKLSRMMPMMNASDFSSRELAEMTWLLSQRNTLDFLSTVPQNRKLRLSYEDIVVSPEQEMQRVCNFLNIDFHIDMITPYSEKDNKMTDGVDTASRMSGDLKFHLHKTIDPAAAVRWQQFYSDEILSDMTHELCKTCGY